MKKFWKYIMISAAAVALLPLAACNDDDEVDPYTLNYVYVYQPSSTFANVEYKANGDFMSGLTDPLKVMPVRLTKPAPNNMQVQVAIDPTLVDEYNEENGTDYTFLQGAEILNPTMTIAKGEYISADSITVGFTDHSGFINQENNLILPIVISQANGAVVSKSSRIFLTFNSTYRPNILSAKSAVTFAAVTAVDGWQNDVKTLNVVDAFTLTYAPYEEVTLNIAIDGNKVSDYNSAHGTSYQFKSDAALAANTLTIGTDANAASFSINTGDLSGLEAGNEYIIPVTVTAANGAAVENDGATVYVLVRPVGFELTMSTSQYTGTRFNLPAGTVVTVNGSETYAGYYGAESWADIVNDQTYSYGYLNPGDVMEIDFGQSFNLSSLYFDNYSNSYAITSLAMQTSVDGQKWDDWGTVAWTSRSARFYINKSFASQARYVKITYLTCYNTRYGIDLESISFYAE